MTPHQNQDYRFANQGAATPARRAETATWMKRAFGFLMMLPVHLVTLFFVVLGVSVLVQPFLADKTPVVQRITDPVADAMASAKDKIEEIDVKWNVIEAQKLAEIHTYFDVLKADQIGRINDRSATVQGEIDTRRYAAEKHIDAVDFQMLPSIITGFGLALQCAAKDMGGMQGACAAAPAHREQLVSERDRLVGDVGLIYTDAELKAQLGVSDEFMANFRPGG